MPPVAWQPWHTAAFLDAQRRRRPVLLLLETAWAPACAHAHATVFARDDVQQAIADTVVPVRVDADRRPDIGDRYGLGHWPSVLFLTPEGLVLTGGTRLDEALAARIRDVAGAFAERDGAWPHVPDGTAALPEPAGPTDEAAAIGAIAAAIWRTRDPATGAFADAGMPSPGAALFALAHAMITEEGEWFGAAADTLDAMPRPLRAGDDEDDAALPGGGNGAPLTRLEDHAEWTRVHARALQLEPRPAWHARLEALVAGLQYAFRRPDGYWRPWVGASSVVLVDASARACVALLAAADALQRPELARDAIDALELLAPRAYGRAAGVAHVVERGEARGPMLLDDAMLLADALLAGAAWREDAVYRDLGEELLRTTLARLQGPSGALVDRVASLAGAGRVGRLADPHHPLVGNAGAARLLVRLFPGDVASTDEARRILRAIVPDAVGAGVFAAPVGLAWHALGSAGDVIAMW